MLAGMLLASRPCALALNPSLEINQYAHSAWKISEGFTRGVIHDVTQTPDGYLWLGTESGMVRFDGVQRVPWTPPGGEQLASSNIRSLLVTRDGTLWIGTAKGLASWSSGRLIRYAELDNGHIGSLVEDREGSVWAAALNPDSRTGKLCEIRKGAVQCSGPDDSMGRVYALYEHQGDLWAGTATAIWRWKPGPPRVYPIAGQSPPIQMQTQDLSEGDNGALWIATYGGLLQLVDGRVEAYRLPIGGQVKARKLFRDRDGGLWIATYGQGLFHLHQGRIDAYTSADGLSGDSVSRLFEDREGNIWAATNDGLDRFREFAIPTISSRQGLSGTVGSVLPTRDGSVWIGTTEGLSRWRNGQITTYRTRSLRPLARPAQQPAAREITDEGLPSDYIQSIFQDERERIWVATAGGVAYFEDGRFTRVSSPPGGLAHAIVEEGAGNLWINDQRLGLLRLLDGRVVEQIPWTQLGNDYASTLAADPLRGGLWLGFLQGGLAYFKDGRIRARHTTADRLGEGRVNRIRFDRDGALWASTEGGLSRLKEGRIATMTSRNGLPCDAAHWSIEDDAGSLWIKMACGLVNITRSELDAWTAEPDRTVKVTVFDSSDGARSFAIAGGFSPRVAKAADGKLWFEVVYGVSVIDPLHLPLNKVPPPVQIEQITANRQAYPLTSDRNGRLRLPPLIRDLEIDYTALSLAAPEKVRFRYKLEGQDPDWKETGDRKAIYGNLRPRTYRFRVMACNNNGVWNEAGASFDFSIDPAYYQATWFRVSCGAAFLALLGAIYWWRLRQVEERFALRLEGRVHERTRIARELHDTLLQSFQGVLMKFSAGVSMIRDRPAEAEAMLDTAVEQARTAITEGRDAVQGLRRSTVEMNSLAEAIGSVGEGLAGPSGPAFHVHVDGDSRDLEPLVRDEVHRVTCEAVRNAFRHAEAQRIDVELRYDRRQFRLRVRDDGKGIDQAVLNSSGREGHFGLPGMQERARVVGGKLAVFSRPGAGTEVELTIPASFAYKKAAASGSGDA
jgi:ligand-binding sensor domain-containing protein/signal transduction histidine kinase